MLSWLRGLLRPSAKYSVLALVGAGLVLGVVGVLGFNATMHATNTEAFCTSCHEMGSNPFPQLQETTHFSNPSGVHASCSDCHVPKEFVPKMIRKIQASREVWGHFTGVIDTPEKYAAHAPAMKAREVARLKANNSQECRNCHEVERMLETSQTAKARKYHLSMESQGKTCIDCHAGIAHPRNLPGVAASH
ncbi:NapC/NirT family cytochrome c [Parahaliea maris]|uniref:NapC/NirT family cytochrome c n=1 Tax=Parahaliea maris TaxID=2716870 RepID=UPI001BB42006|nr:NapC/NirT family cytochrome c [Parahaliea maris]